MTQPRSASEIEDEAAAWALRLADHPDPTDALDAWMEGDPRRSGALLRAQAALSLMDRARALDGVDVRAVPRADPPPNGPSRRDLALAGVAAAALVGGVGLGVATVRPGRMETRFGEIRRAPLGDGSVAVLNARTVVDVSLLPRTRVVRLSRGEVWFDVAHDAGRPFIVASGPARVRAVGTAFSVRRDGRRTEVMVTDGIVETWIDDGRGASRSSSRLSVGAKAVLDPDTLSLVSATDARDVGRRLAWRTGEIELDGDTVAEAATQFNRYNRRKLLIEDPALARRPFIGLFQLDEPDAFARAVAATTGSEVELTVSTIRLHARTAS